jgi:putative ABC transport system ATP-binding protein
LDLVEMGSRRTHLPGKLSGGEQQRVAVARALVTKPALLLADEPTGDLDRDTGRRLHETLRGLNRSRNLTVLVVTHNDDLARACDRVLRLTGGRLVPA